MKRNNYTQKELLEKSKGLEHEVEDSIMTEDSDEYDESDEFERDSELLKVKGKDPQQQKRTTTENTNTAGKNERREEHSNVKKKVARSCPKFFKTSFIVIGLGIAIYSLCEFYLNKRKDMPDIPINELLLDKELLSKLKELRTIFPSQEKRLWSTCFSVIQNVNKRSPPGVIMFLQERNRNSAECFVNKLSYIARNVHKLYEPPLKINGSTIEKELTEPSQLNVYKTIRDSYIVLITEMEKIPADIIRHFHSFCDSLTPVVKGALYFFILEVNSINSSNPTDKAFNTLMSIWGNNLDDSISLPLITRLTQNVVTILNEKAVTCDL